MKKKGMSIDVAWKIKLWTNVHRSRVDNKGGITLFNHECLTSVGWIKSEKSKIDSY